MKTLPVYKTKASPRALVMKTVIVTASAWVTLLGLSLGAYWIAYSVDNRTARTVASGPVGQELKASRREDAGTQMRLKIHIAEIQRANGEDPSGIIRTGKTLGIMMKQATEDELAPLVDVQAIRKEAFDSAAAASLEPGK